MKERPDKYPWVAQPYLCLVDQSENSIIVVLWGFINKNITIGKKESKGNKSYKASKKTG